MKYYILDFDGTITLKDTLVSAFDKYCIDDWMIPENIMRNGMISRTQSLFEEVELMRVSETELYGFLAGEIRFRDGFDRFIRRVSENGDRMIILSGGFSSFIEFLLRKGGYDHQSMQVSANDIKYMGESCWEFVPNPDALPPMCGICPNCKRAVVEKIKNEGYETVYVGDGDTDFCASVFADEIFACGELAQRLKEQGIKHRIFNSFDDISD